ncbi:hypothetical protein ACFY4I_07395 [Streptomyces scabiei]|uniref:hypothetical protein n=1 Tax=Streptomyces scabiei TaxID=1930 RepID=UPI00369A0588
MNPRRLSRAALPAAAAVLCGLLASCTDSSASPANTVSASALSPNAVSASASPSGAGQAVSASPAAAPSAAASVKTLPASRLCAVLDRTAARLVLTDPIEVPRVAPGKGTAPDSCGYASGDRTTMLTLNPASRSYDAERAASHRLVDDPASAGMRDVKVAEVSGLGQAAFSETVEVLQPRQHVTFLVWRAGSRTWLLTLARFPGAKDGADQLVPLARRITPRLDG